MPENAEEATRYEIYSAIQDQLLHSLNMGELVDALLKRGIEIQYYSRKYPDNTVISSDSGADSYFHHPR